MLLIDIKDKELTQEEVEMLEHPLVSGLILFTRNFYDKAQIQALVKSIRQRVKNRCLLLSTKKAVGCNAFVKALLNCRQCNLLTNLPQRQSKQCN